MNLLICTQAVDPRDIELGFFPAWIEGLAPNYKNITVLCLRAKGYTLPSNVKVITMGTGRVARALNVLRYCYTLRRDYDAVFVHMNQEYVLLAGWLWQRLRKPVYLWRNHYSGTKATDFAAKRVNKVFFTSNDSYTARFRNAVKMPVGIDTRMFKRLPEVPRDPRGILFLGRLAPSKRPHLLLQALALLFDRGTTFSALMCGPSPVGDSTYIEKLKDIAHELRLGESIQFMPGVPHAETPQMFNRHAIFVNCSPSGMYDKTMFEAASCECMVVASSKDFAALVPQRFAFADNDAEDLARKLEVLLKLPVVEQQGAGAQMHNVAKQHDLPHLIERLVQEIRP